MKDSSHEPNPGIQVLGNFLMGGYILAALAGLSPMIAEYTGLEVHSNEISDTLAKYASQGGDKLLYTLIGTTVFATYFNFMGRTGRMSLFK